MPGGGGLMPPIWPAATARASACRRIGPGACATSACTIRAGGCGGSATPCRGERGAGILAASAPTLVFAGMTACARFRRCRHVVPAAASPCVGRMHAQRCRDGRIGGDVNRVHCAGTAEGGKLAPCPNRSDPSMSSPGSSPMPAAVFCWPGVPRAAISPACGSSPAASASRARPPSRPWCASCRRSWASRRRSARS